MLYHTTMGQNMSKQAVWGQWWCHFTGTIAMVQRYRFAMLFYSCLAFCLSCFGLPTFVQCHDFLASENRNMSRDGRRSNHMSVHNIQSWNCTWQWFRHANYMAIIYIMSHVTCSLPNCLYSRRPSRSGGIVWLETLTSRLAWLDHRHEVTSPTSIVKHCETSHHELPTWSFSRSLNFIAPDACLWRICLAMPTSSLGTTTCCSANLRIENAC